MAKEKKRGFFSWLGFGQKEQTPEKETEVQNEQPVVEEIVQAQEPVKASEQAVEEQPQAHTEAEAETFAADVVEAVSYTHLATTPISWVTSSIPGACFCIMLSSRSRMRACATTSRSVVGSSAMINGDSHSTAIAIIMRCNMPPLISNG